MSRSLRLATLFLTFWGLQASHGDDAAVTAALANGDAALVRLDLDAALTAFRTASQLDTNHYVVAWKLARALSDKATLTTDRNQQTQLLAYSYTSNPELFDGSQGGNDAAGNPTPAMVSSAVNNGAGLILPFLLLPASALSASSLN